MIACGNIQNNFAEAIKSLLNITAGFNISGQLFFKLFSNWLYVEAQNFYLKYNWTTLGLGVSAGKHMLMSEFSGSGQNKRKVNVFKTAWISQKSLLRIKEGQGK